MPLSNLTPLKEEMKIYINQLLNFFRLVFDYSHNNNMKQETDSVSDTEENRGEKQILKEHAEDFKEENEEEEVKGSTTTNHKSHR